MTCRIALCLSFSKKIAPIQARWDWPAAQLAHALGLSAEALRARIMFWINQGVIAEARTAAGLVSHPSVILPSTSVCTRCPFLQERGVLMLWMLGTWNTQNAGSMLISQTSWAMAPKGRQGQCPLPAPSLCFAMQLNVHFCTQSSALLVKDNIRLRPFGDRIFVMCAAVHAV